MRNEDSNKNKYGRSSTVRPKASYCTFCSEKLMGKRDSESHEYESINKPPVR